MESKATAAAFNDTGLLQTPELCKYILETCVYPRDPDPLKELNAVTSQHPRPIMRTAPDACQFMALMLKLINAKKTIEVGVFTGYSLLLTALTIPEDGQPQNKETFDFAFVDADKFNNANFHEKLMELLKTWRSSYIRQYPFGRIRGIA